MNREALIEAYRRQHPQSELSNVQVNCIQPLLAIQALHNWRHVIQGFTRPDGGFRACGPDGIFVLMRYGRLSTFDDSGLTNLVLAAHEHHMRVDIGTGGFNTLRIQVDRIGIPKDMAKAAQFIQVLIRTIAPEFGTNAFNI